MSTIVIKLATLAVVLTMNPPAPRVESNTLGLFGTYTMHYMHRRWARMCKGPARYDAMREAYELGAKQPC
jgi:hypothetical protein